jgi:hypothetical protein
MGYVQFLFEICPDGKSSGGIGNGILLLAALI